MIKNIRHAGIVIHDLDASLHFYRDLLNLKIERQMEEAGDYIDQALSLKNTRVTTIKMSVPDGQMIELLYYHSHPRAPKDRDICDIGITHVAFTVDNLDEEYQRLQAAGVIFHAPPQTSPDGLAKLTFCKAPEGTFVELVELIKT